MGERVDSLVEVLRKQAHSKRKTEPDLCLTMHRMVLSKLTKDLIGTEMRLAGKIHGKYCWDPGVKELLCWLIIRERQIKCQWDNASPGWAGEARSLDVASVSTWGSNIFLSCKITNLYGRFPRQWSGTQVPPLRIFCLLTWRRRGEWIIGIRSCLCHSLHMVTCCTRMQPLVKRNNPKSCPVLNAAQSSPLGKMQPLHQVLWLEGRSCAHTHPTQRVENEENGKHTAAFRLCLAAPKG